MTSMVKIKKIAGIFLPEGTGIRKMLFFSIDILLLALILMLGSAMFQNYHTTGTEPENAYAGSAEPFKTQTAKPDPRNSKLDDYRIIWERNLFNTSGKANPVSKDEFENAKIVMAKKDMGLKLIGTVVSDNPDLNRAIILNFTTGVLKTYRKGRRIDGGLIKEIKDLEVIISTGNSNELLALRIGDASTLPKIEGYAPQIADKSVSIKKASAWYLPSNRSNSIVLTREEVDASLTDISKVEKLYEISSFIKGKHPIGFRIGNIIPDSIFDKMGLKYGEAITAVNGKSIAGPGEFFQQLKKGGDVTIKVQKRRGVRRRARSIHMNIS